jgi:tRNA nucleotidyltransferase/poly(A) polymerase
MRAVKYAVRLGFEWSEETQLLIEKALDAMPLISQAYHGGGERIRDELKEFLLLPQTDDKVRWLQYMVDHGVTRLFDTSQTTPLDLPLPVATINDRLLKVITHLTEALNDVVHQPIEQVAQWRAALWQCQLNLLLLGFPKPLRQQVAKRLILNRHELDALEHSDALLTENSICTLSQSSSAAELFQVFHHLPAGAILTGLILSPRVSENLHAYVRYLKELADVKLAVTGEDIIKLGVEPGEQIGALLKALHVEKLNGTVSNRSDEMDWLKGQLSS